MTDDRKSGIALIAGSLGSILTMAVHPVGTATLTLEQVERLAIASAAAHSLAIVSFFVLFLGACGLARKMAAEDRIAFAALVSYGLACVAGLIAASVSGFIVPEIIRHMAHDAAANAGQWNMIIYAVFQINQAFARILAVASSVAIVLWAVSALRNGALSRWIAVYGCIVAPLVMVGIGSGHLRLNVHGMALVAIAEAVWFIVVGAQLCSSSGERSREPSSAA